MLTYTSTVAYYHLSLYISLVYSPYYTKEAGTNAAIEETFPPVSYKMVLLLTATLITLLNTAQAWTGHAANSCRILPVKPRSTPVEDKVWFLVPDSGNCFNSLNVCMDWYHPSPSELYITLTNKAHNAFICFSDDKNWESCVQASAGVPCNAGIPINDVRIYASLYYTP